MDTPSQEPSTAALSVNEAASLFANALDPQPVEEEKKEAPEPAAEAQADAETDEPANEDEAPAEEVQKVTIQVDGKTVELTPEQIAEAYKNGLRQEDYTKKTMAAAELRKTADAEAARAREERQQYAQGLQQNHALLTAALQEQQRIDWDALLQSDPQEYLKQKHLYDRRQAALHETNQRGQQLASYERAEAKKSLVQKLQAEHQAVLDKLPEWKDEKKAAAEKSAIVKELIDRGFERERIFGQADADGTPSLDNPGLADHRILLLARDAMLYREMLGKAKAAAQKVSNLPQKVERPGVSETNGLDRRTSLAKQFEKNPNVNNAAAVFASLL